MKGTGFAALGMLALLGGTVDAHHSHPDFLLDQDATIQGTIERIEFKNPHVLITLRTEDSSVYTAEWQSALSLVHPGTNRHAPIASDALKIGDFIVVIGAPDKDPARHELALLKSVSRPKDGWQWRD